MKIVKFKNGKYGVRRRSIFGYRFLGRNRDHWWFDLRHVHRWAEFETLEEATAAFNDITDAGEPVSRAAHLGSL